MFIKIAQWFPIILLVACSCVPAPKPAQVPLPMAMAEVEPLLAERRYAEAAVVLEEIAQTYPDTPLPFIKLGQIYLRQHRWLLAEDAFNRALARELDNPAAKAGLAETWFNQGRLADALAIWQELVDTQPQLPGVFTGLGQTSLWLFDFDSARAAFIEQQDHGFDPQAQWYLAALEAPDDVTLATDRLQAISSAGDTIESASPELLTQRDYLLDVLAPFTVQSARAEVARATGIALAQIELWPLAVHALNMAVEVDNQPDAETLAFLGYALAKAGRPAMAVFEQAEKADPTSPLPMYFQGLYLREQGAFRAAEALFREALVIDPKNAAFYIELGRTRAQQGDLGTAESAYLAAVEVTGNDLQFQKLLVEFYADRGYRITEAGLPAAETLVELDEHSAEAQALLGRMQVLAGSLTEGEVSLRRALELDPDLISARYHLARLLEGQGQAELARVEYQQVVDWDTGGDYRKLALVGIKRLDAQ